MNNVIQLLSRQANRMVPVAVVCIGSALAFACNNTENKEPVEYKGPLSEAENVELFFSEKERVKVRITPEHVDSSGFDA